MTDKTPEAYTPTQLAPPGASFRVGRVKRLYFPHPFMITARHIAYFTSDHYSGVLAEAAIEASGAPCGMERCQLSYADHEAYWALHIYIPHGETLQTVAGLSAYLLSIKAEADAAGVDGFAFLQDRAQETEKTS